jgi:hypothetical protein
MHGLNLNYEFGTMLKETVMADFNSLSQKLPGSMTKITNLSQDKWPMAENRIQKLRNKKKER